MLSLNKATPAHILRSPIFAWGLAAVVLAWHATVYDFFCDDGYIALRYSQSLLSKGELTYNTGERVEGFTSPLWVLLVALFGIFGASLVTCAKILGAASALGTLVITSHLWRRLAPQHSPRFVYAVIALLVASPPFAAWALGGLEAPLFAFTVGATLVLLANAWDNPKIETWGACGLAAGLSGLARPEGMALAALCVAWAGLRAVRNKDWTGAVACVVPVVVVLGGYLAFRLAYYGYPFPNTYYVKTSGGAGLGRRGFKYVTAMARQFGWLTVFSLVGALLYPLFSWRSHLESAKVHPSFGVLHVTTRLLVVGFIVYLTRIGGDFLDLYRFMVPTLPLAFCLIVAAGLDLWTAMRNFVLQNRRLTERVSTVSLRWGLRACTGLVVGVLAFSHAQHNLWMAAQSLGGHKGLVPKDAPKRPHGVERIGWTRTAALQWAALGRALSQRARRGDSMAMGAAGAGPYTAQMKNLDLFGLTDTWVAHHGRTVSSRPGHQRFASNEYIREWKPTYLLLQRAGSKQPKPDLYWNNVGYASATLRVSKKRHGAVETHYVSILVRKERVRELKKHRGWRFL